MEEYDNMSSNKQKKEVVVLGAGSWGMTLAIHLFKKGHKIRLWEFSQERVASLLSKRENIWFLPGITIPEDIFITSNIDEACQKAEVVIVAIPSHTVREVVTHLVGHLEEGAIIISVVKGLEEKTSMRPSQIIEEILGGWQIGVLSGPSHAEEVSREIPTTVVASSVQKEISASIQHLFITPNFRVYTNEDLIGVELGGALKNIIAIAAGISDGLGFGDNTKAALLTRGLTEMTRLGVAMGAKSQTFAGLSGMGDLIVTCISKFSRNRHLGEMIGRGITLKEALKKMVMVAEGIRTTKAASEMAKFYGVELPITEEVFKVLFEGKSPREAVSELMLREPKPEIFG